MFCRLKKKNATCAFQCFFRIQSAFGCLNLYISLWPWNPRIEIGLVNAVVKYRTTAWQAFEVRERGFWAGKKREAGGGGGWGGREGEKGMQVGHYFHVINIHQANVKILIGQFSKHVNHGLDTNQIGWNQHHGRSFSNHLKLCCSWSVMRFLYGIHC